MEMKTQTKFLIISLIFTTLPFLLFVATSFLFWPFIDSFFGNIIDNLYYNFNFDIYNLLYLLFIIPIPSWLMAIIFGLKLRKLERQLFSLILIVLNIFFLVIYPYLLFGM